MYKVSVRTGDMFGAGTDASVFLTVYGDLGDTGERKLAKSENNKNKFERGQVFKKRSIMPAGPSVCQTESLPFFQPQVDRFTVEAVDLGQVFKIHVRHDNSLMGADWYLDQVEVLDMETEEVYMFLCERWLSTKKEDKRVDRTFYVKVCFTLVTPEGDSFVSGDCFMWSAIQGYEGERNTDPNSKKMAQAKQGLDKNANKKKKKKKMAVVEEGPSEQKKTCTDLSVP